MSQTRQQKIHILKKVFETGNKSILEGTNDMVITTVIVERNGWYQIIEIEQTFKVPDKELSKTECQEFISSLPLFPDLKNDLRR